MRQAEQLVFQTLDGTSIFYRHWPAHEPSGPAIVLLHRGHEHSGRLQYLVDELNLPGFAMFAWDARGHGRSPGRRGYAPSAGTLAKDLDTFVRHIETNHGIAAQDVALIGQSVGSVIAAAWLHDYAPRVRCAVLAAPAFQIKLYVPFARPALRAMHAMRGDFTVQSYVKANYLTHDPERIRDYEQDPLITRAISVRVLLDLYATARRVVSDAHAIQTPVQVLISGSDWVVDKKPQLDFFKSLGSRVKEQHEFPDFYHDTLGEKDRHLAIGKAREFVERAFARSLERPCLLDADHHGPTKEEFDRLRRPAPLPRKVAFGAIRRGIETGGRLSDGIRLGLATGFDSGSSLDYVYRNQASGYTLAGKLIDRWYIDSAGWRGIRVRKRHVELFIERASAELRSRGLPVHIVDIAAGHGRYVLDAAAGCTPDSILLRDFDAGNVTRGSEFITERGLAPVARFERGDAFDRSSLADLGPRTLALVSGLYELFPENRMVRNSLAGVAKAVRPCGYLIYTGQPWHPQLEMIARTLRSHRNGQPWVMRRRTQAELDQLVESAGFRKIDQLTDDWGMFTVSLAQRIVG